MTRSISLLILFLALFISSIPDVAGQASSPEGAIRLYNTVFANQLHIFNGPVYKKIPEPYEGTPIFGDDMWNKGIVHYDGQFYENVEMFYDTYQDVLVVEHFDKKGHPAYFTPPAAKILYFEMQSARFVTIPAEARERFTLPGGYYQELITGPLNFYAKRKTSLYEQEKEGKYVPTFKNEDSYYIKYGESYHEVRSKASFKKLFREHKKNINRFTRENNLLFFKETREQSLKRLVSHLNELVVEGGNP